MFFLFIMAIQSCGIGTYADGVSSNDIKRIALFRPVTRVQHWHAKSEASEDSLRRNHYSMIIDLFSNYLPVSTVIEDTDVSSEANQLFSTIRKCDELNEIWFAPVPASLILKLNNMGERYGLVISAVGTTRDGKYSIQFNESSVQAAIIDAYQRKVVFYNCDFSNTSPINKKPVNAQVRRIVKGSSHWYRQP